EIGNDTVPSFSGTLWLCGSCAAAKGKITKERSVSNIRDESRIPCLHRHQAVNWHSTLKPETMRSA
ncbi:MAG: hypothetical protein ACRD3W_05205, partial [Terriglobales bacterium]